MNWEHLSIIVGVVVTLTGLIMIHQFGRDSVGWVVSFLATLIGSVVATSSFLDVLKTTPLMERAYTISYAYANALEPKSNRSFLPSPGFGFGHETIWICGRELTLTDVNQVLRHGLDQLREKLPPDTPPQGLVLISSVETNKREVKTCPKT